MYHISSPIALDGFVGRLCLRSRQLLPPSDADQHPSVTTEMEVMRSISADALPRVTLDHVADRSHDIRQMLRRHRLTRDCRKMVDWAGEIHGWAAPGVAMRFPR
jgi:hypothetical protein